VQDFEAAYSWASAQGTQKIRLLLGNGFSMAYDSDRFSYKALAAQASAIEALPDLARRIMQRTNEADFESIMRILTGAAITLEVSDSVAHRVLIEDIRGALAELREALAHAIAGLHPERPGDISAERYLNTREFLDRFEGIYTVSYDLLLYWAIMQDLPGHPDRRQNDGFQDSGIPDDETVIWNVYDPYAQTVHYLHGALHLFLGEDGLRKITFIRTSRPLIEQVREQLSAHRFPLFVAEGDTLEKADKINHSAYLSHSLRSFSNNHGGLVIHGHALHDNDSHILNGVVRGKYSRVAIGIFKGDPGARGRGDLLTSRRSSYNPRRPLQVQFYDAESVQLW
jgi:hypothetical protein